MVSKFKTFGKAAFGCLTLSAMITFAADISAEGSQATFGNPAISFENCKDRTVFKTDEALQDCVNRLLESQSGGNSCEKARSDFTSALNDFGGSCGKAQLGKSEKNGLACSGALLKCNEDQSDLYNEGEEEDDDYLEEEESERYNDMAALKLYDVEKLKGQYNVCPVMAQEDFKEFRKEVVEAQERVDKLENEIPDLNEKIDQVQSTLGEKLTELQKRSSDAQKEYRDGLKAINRGKSDATKQIMNQVVQAQANIDRIEADIRTAQQSKVEAEMKMDEAIKAINLSCHKRATEEISRRRIEMFTLMQQCRASKLSPMPRGACESVNAGSFNKALGKVGLSSWGEDQKLATDYYNKCIKAKDTRSLVDSAAKTYNLFCDNVDKTIVSMEQQKKRVEESIQKLKGSEGCGPGQTDPTTATELCTVMKNAEEDIADLKKAANETVAQIKAEVDMANKNAKRELDTRQDALARKNAQLEREKNYLRQKREVMALKQDASGGRSMSTEDYGKLWANFDKLNNAAYALQGPCCPTGNTHPECESAKYQRESAKVYGDERGLAARATSATTTDGMSSEQIPRYIEAPIYNSKSGKPMKMGPGSGQPVVPEAKPKNPPPKGMYDL